MKLESTLRQNNAVLLAAPVLDTVLVLMIFFLLGSNFVLRSGISVDLPFSTSTLPPVARAHVITVSPGFAPVIYFDETRITMGELREELESRSGGSRNVILKADRLASHGIVMEITDIILSQGYELAMATSFQRENP